MIKGVTHVHLGPILVSFRTFRHSLFLKSVSCFGLFLQLLTARRLQDRCGILRIRLLEIHNTLNIKIELIKEKIENLPNTKKVTNVALFPAVMTVIFYTLYNTCTVEYIHTWHTCYHPRQKKIGKNSDLNELHCRTFIASKT